MEKIQPAAIKWQQEYAKGGIPSSTRTEPSGSVVWAVGELRRHKFALRHAVDVGCGKGRNSLYLAREGMHVTAMDFTPDAIAALKQGAAVAGLAANIRPIVQDVTEDWPVADASIDLVVDAFCFKHVVLQEARATYRRNLLRVLATHGHYMISFASIGDGYYGQYLKPNDADRGEGVIVDPENGIESVLYSKKRVMQLLAPELELFAELESNKPSPMHGQDYVRQTYALIFRRSMRVM